jgi:hypothetical protein
MTLVRSPENLRTENDPASLSGKFTNTKWPWFVLRKIYEQKMTLVRSPENLRAENDPGRSSENLRTENDPGSLSGKFTNSKWPWFALRKIYEQKMTLVRSPENSRTENNPGTHWIEGCVGPGPGRGVLERIKILAPVGIQTLTVQPVA